MGLEEAEDAQAAVVCVMAAPFMSMPCVFCEQAAPSVACDMHTSHADIIPLRSTGSLLLYLGGSLGWRQPGHRTMSNCSSL